MHEMSRQAQNRQLAVCLQQHEVTCWAGCIQPSQMAVVFVKQWRNGSHLASSHLFCPFLLCPVCPCMCVSLYIQHHSFHSSFALDTSCVVTVLVLVQVPGGSRIVSMILNRRGTRLLVNCYDRVVRLYETCQPGKRRRSYTAADLKTRLASAKVSHPRSCPCACFCSWLAMMMTMIIV